MGKLWKRRFGTSGMVKSVLIFFSVNISGSTDDLFPGAKYMTYSLEQATRCDVIYETIPITIVFERDPFGVSG